MDAVRQNPIGLTCKPLQRMCNNRMLHITTIKSSLLMFPLTPDQHHWLDVARRRRPIVPCHVWFTNVCNLLIYHSHVTLLEKLAALDLPDHVYNWLVNFFSGRTQCTTFLDTTSGLQEISSSIVQGSAVGPASYVVNASDLKAVNGGNVLCKYADNTY